MAFDCVEVAQAQRGFGGGSAELGGRHLDE